MGKCSNCGLERKESDKFCLNCGHEFKNKSAPATSVAPLQTKIPSVKRKKRLAGLLTAAVFLGAVIAAHLFLEAKYDVSKKIIDMNQAFSKEDPTKFLSYFMVPDDVISDEEGFYDFIEKEGWTEVRNRLKTESVLVENGGLADIILDSNGNKLLSIVSEPKLFGLYHDISFLVHPVALEVLMPLDKTTISIAQKTITGNAGDKKTVGKFLPGSYGWTASAASAYAPITSKNTADVHGDGDNFFLLDPALDAGTLTVTSDVADAILWIDGKSTKKTVKEQNTIGPVPFDGSLKISAETTDASGKKVESVPLVVNTDTAHLTFTHVQEQAANAAAQRQQEEEMQEFMDFHENNMPGFIQDFRNGFESALNDGDYFYVASYFPMDSSIEAEYIAKMDEHANSSVYYYYDFLTTEITNVEATDRNTLYVYTEEEFLYSLEDKLFRYFKTKVYTLSIIKNGYHITEIKELTNVKKEI
ncbi:TcaA 3rd/4th domain-containing protein [Planococcus shenhongbingii]|uniref:Zinc ribbon domain-containing protein n=1 Tax=Planococcus shenhongbingii TaxID=3058398 RepID=A0ABT8N9S6_9BACL|nr:zinc-ribbon domain-containing protein [Planococcus sp. N017]MDN7244647.1 hypothetical protein [Planococcus sp. N017]